MSVNMKSRFEIHGTVLREKSNLLDQGGLGLRLGIAFMVSTSHSICPGSIIRPSQTTSWNS